LNVLSNTAKKVGLNTIFNTLGGVSIHLLTIVTGVYIARHFGAEDFGQLTYAATIIGYFSLITEFGLTTIANRFLSHMGQPEKYLFSYITIRLGLTAVALMFLAALLFITPFPAVTLSLILVYALMIPLQIFRLNWIFYSQQNMLLDNLLQVAEKILYVACLFSLVVFLDNIIIVPISLVMSIVISCIMSWIFFISRKQAPLNLNIDRPFINTLIKDGWKVGVAGSALTSNNNIDTIFVNAYRGDVQTGLYGAAYKLINAAISAGTFFTNAVFPVSCIRYKNSIESLAQLINYSSKLLSLVTVPTIILLSYYSDELIQLIFGAGYRDAAAPFRILILSAGLSILCRLYHNTLVACERQNTFMRIVLYSVFVNLTLNFALIPRYGIIGAATATIITELFLLIFSYIYLSRVLKNLTSMSMISVSACAAIASLSLIPELHILLKISLYLSMYLILIVLFGLLGFREQRLIKDIFQRT
jgi:O-antigen/teichoic acid export membrane protein